MGIRGRCGELVNGLTVGLTDWQTGKERGSCVSIKKGNAERSSEEQQSLLVVWKYKDTWRESRNWRYGRWWLLKAVECWGTYQDMCEFMWKPEFCSMHMGVCLRVYVHNNLSHCYRVCMSANKLALVRCVTVCTRASLRVPIYRAFIWVL